MRVSLRLLLVVPVCLYAITLLPLVTSSIDSVLKREKREEGKKGVTGFEVVLTSGYGKIGLVLILQISKSKTFASFSCLHFFVPIFL